VVKNGLHYCRKREEDSKTTLSGGEQQTNVGCASKGKKTHSGGYRQNKRSRLDKKRVGKTRSSEKPDLSERAGERP